MNAKKTFSCLIVFLIFTSCISKSAQAKLKGNNVNQVNKKSNGVNKINISSKTTKTLFQPTSSYDQIISHNYFTLSYSEKDEQPEWVFYKVSVKNYKKQIRRTNDYREDPLVKTSSASPKDYKGSGYDMGHLAPAHAMAQNYKAMSESFYLSNISPQKPSFNRGIWRSLENKVEFWSSFNDSIYVVAGPILDNPIDIIGENKLSVPRAFYKTLISFKGGEAKGLAFIIPNKKSTKSIYSYVTSIDEVEKITGIDFYHNLDTAIQDRVEANLDVKKWLSLR
jgi:endonuclease G